MSANPGSGKAGVTTGTLFTFSAPRVHEQPGCVFVYTWTFDDGAFGDGEVITHRYATEGTGKNKTYTVKLVISTLGVDVPWSDTRNVVVNP
jgi:PKD domain